MYFFAPPFYPGYFKQHETKEKQSMDNFQSKYDYKSTFPNCPRCRSSFKTADAFIDHTCDALAKEKAQPEADPVNAPKHYTSHPSGVECITITEHMGFNLGNALKYLWRADLKNNAMEDLEKAKWYIEREIAKRKKGVA